MMSLACTIVANCNIIWQRHRLNELAERTGAVESLHLPDLVAWEGESRFRSVWNSYKRRWCLSLALYVMSQPLLADFPELSHLS